MTNAEIKAKELADFGYQDPYTSPNDTPPASASSASSASSAGKVPYVHKLADNFSNSHERGDHSTFTAHALCAQQLKETLRRRGGWSVLSPVERECIEVILSSVAGMVESPEEKHSTRWLKIASVATHGRNVA
jgi:hypothetical protein